MSINTRSTWNLANRRAEAARWGVAIATTLLVHAGLLALGLGSTKPQYRRPPTAVTVVRTHTAPPPPPPPRPRARKKVIDLTGPPSQARKAQDVPPPPVFGLGKKSFSSTGTFTMRMGNTVGVRPEDAPPRSDLPAAVPAYTVTTMPRILGEPKPSYPADLRSAGLEGDVVLDVLVDDQGVVRDVSVVSATDPGFVDAARTAMFAVRFAPAELNGEPVSVRVRIPVRFRLR